MSENHVTVFTGVSDISADDVLSLFDKALGTAAFIAKLTPTPKDDAVVATLQNIRSQSWFPMVVTILMGFIEKKTPADQVKDVLAGIIKSAN